jgi:hypothetical protein
MLHRESLSLGPFSPAKVATLLFLVDEFESFDFFVACCTVD